jgi:trehalose 6-phosphate synthase
MLGADLIGFHIQQHCTNFLDTVDRTVESRIDWERFVVNRQDHKTIVKPFPISVALTPSVGNGMLPAKPTVNKETLFKQLGVKGQYLAVGVDRIDYTKGIIERFRGIERFLEKNPQYQGRFVFVEFGAPSRTLIKTLPRSYGGSRRRSRTDKLEIQNERVATNCFLKKTS